MKKRKLKKNVKKSINITLIIGFLLLAFGLGYKLAENKYEQKIPCEFPGEFNLTESKEFEEPIIVAITAGVKEEDSNDTNNNNSSDFNGDVSDSRYSEEQTEIEQENYQEEQEEIYSNYSEPETVETIEKVQYGSRDVLLSEDELWELARIIYFENGITYPECTYTTVKYTADVLLNRLQQWGYSNAYDVIFDAGQYSTAYKYENVGAYEEGWNISWTALYDALENPDYNPVFQSTFPQGTTYYIDPYTGECFGY